jgi:hypothetical protein
MRLFALALVGGFSAVLVGCGPLAVPMPQRLPDADQKAVDEFWAEALAPVGKHDRQTWLDALVGRQLYQHGVDRLTFRSEKAVAGGTVVMEIDYDRANPAGDRFEVTVLGPGGQRLRKERYTREDVERTVRDLFNDPAADPQARQARWDKLNALFPAPKPANPPAAGR